MSVTLHVWNVRNTPWPIESETVQTIVTSPPYWGLRDYGVEGQLGLERDPRDYVAQMVIVFREAARVLKPRGTLWVNIGDTHYTAKGACWNPGGNSMSRHAEMKAEGVIPSASAAPNRMLTRAKAREMGLKPGDLVGIPARLAQGLQADGWILRSRIIWAKPNPAPESVQNRPTMSYEEVLLLSRRPGYYYDADAIRTPITDSTLARLSQPTFDTQTGGPKDYGGNRSVRRSLVNLKKKIPSNWDVGTGSHREGVGRYKHDVARITSATSANRVWEDDEAKQRIAEHGANARDVWVIATQPFSGPHYATMPTELARRCVAAGSRRGDLVLDPFSGAGTTCLVADRLGRDAVGLELNPRDVEMARRRIEDDAPMFASVEVGKPEADTLPLGLDEEPEGQKAEGE